MEPFYIRQTAEPMTDAERRDWFNICAQEAKTEGAEICRFSVGNDASLALVEGWKGKLYEIGDQGEPRFVLTAERTNKPETPAQ